ncbi:hypothetical protein RCL_jg10226.t1 [Rhizophagus clarus]|uniref:Uncharacterized protein n=1 Tax=Rhizophagus clarus TaxID=94130 RepID=A0A8H3KUU6_9GLOM|nr:hypothetical protein RCL_jg10226.t1 [Rhizophagus clarus]
MYYPECRLTKGSAKSTSSLINTKKKKLREIFHDARVKFVYRVREEMSLDQSHDLQKENYKFRMKIMMKFYKCLSILASDLKNIVIEDIPKEKNITIENISKETLLLKTSLRGIMILLKEISTYCYNLLDNFVFNSSGSMYQAYIGAFKCENLYINYIETDPFSRQYRDHLDSGLKRERKPSFGTNVAERALRDLYLVTLCLAMWVRGETMQKKLGKSMGVYKEIIRYAKSIAIVDIRNESIKIQELMENFVNVSYSKNYDGEAKSKSSKKTSHSQRPSGQTPDKTSRKHQNRKSRGSTDVFNTLVDLLKKLVSD